MSELDDRNTEVCSRCGNKGADAGRHPRYYCPLCGQVQCGMKRHGVFMVVPHYKRRSSDEDGWKSSPCRGGPVDPREDRAP